MDNYAEIQGEDILNKLYDFVNQLSQEVLNHPFMHNECINEKQFLFLKKRQTEIHDQTIRFMTESGFKKWEISYVDRLHSYPIPRDKEKDAKYIIQFQTLEWISRIKFVALYREDPTASPLLNKFDILSKLPDIVMGTTGDYPDFDPVKTDNALKKLFRQPGHEPTLTNSSSKDIEQLPKELLQRWNSLTPREKEVTKLILKGWGDIQIADNLKIKPGTINSHCKKIYVKLGVRGRPQLLAKYGRHNIP